MKIIFILILLMSLPAYAATRDYDTFVKEQQKKQQQIMSVLASEVQNLMAQSNKRKEEIEAHVAWLDSEIAKRDPKATGIKSEKNSGIDQVKTTKNQNNNKNEKILVFVSFSMPETSLRQYINDANNFGASVVIRGLKNNSFKDTAAEILKILGKNKNGEVKIAGGIEINPLVFKEYGINKVPAIVKINELAHDFDVVFGNITLQYALQVIKNKRGN